MPGKPNQYVAAKAIIRHGDSVLLLKQSAEDAVDGANQYHPPGGIVEPGEHLREALIREVNEETGLEVGIGDVIAVEEWRVNIRGEDSQFFGVFFECSLAGSSAVKLQVEEASDFVWASAGDLAQYQILEPSLSVIRKALA